jgi:hypothetical protein
MSKSPQHVCVCVHVCVHICVCVCLPLHLNTLWLCLQTLKFPSETTKDHLVFLRKHRKYYVFG